MTPLGTLGWSALALAGALACSSVLAAAPAVRAHDDVEPMYRSALAAIGEGHEELAENRLRRALEQAPQDDDVRLTLAQIMIESGRRTEAGELLRAGFVVNPGRFALALARVQYEGGDTAGALATLAAAPRHLSGNPWVHAFAGLLRQKTGDHATAIRELRTAVDAEPGHCAWSLALADSLVQVGQEKQAAGVLDAARQSCADRTDFSEYLEQRLREIGNAHQAKTTTRTP